MLFDTILFDLDDTIHDRNKTLYKFVELLEQKYSQALDYESKLIMRDIFLQNDLQGYAPREDVFKKLIERVSWKCEPDLKELIDFWNSEFPRCAEPMDDLYDVLDHCVQKDIKMGIITNGNSDFQNTKIDKLDLRKYMNTIIISEDVNIRKPDPKIFQLALSRINSNGENTLFVGDHPIVDVKGANDSGLISVWLNHGHVWDTKNYTPKYCINTLSELLQI